MVEGQPLSAFLATAHEWGHSLYEQGLPRTGDHYFPGPLVMRFELELALIEQELPVEELPQHWDQRLSELLGINQSNDSEGCLQSWSTDA